MAAHSSILAWRIPGTGSLGGCRPWGRTGSDTTERLSSNSTERKPLECKTRHHPTTSSTPCRMPHLNNKQNKNTSPSAADRITTSLSLSHRRKNKQANKQKPSTNLTLYEAYTNHWTQLRRAETKRKKEFHP